MPAPLTNPASASTVPAVTAVLLLVSAVLITVAVVIGPGALSPTHLGWLADDPATHYLGWAFLRQTEDWMFPLTWTDRLGYPWGISISFSDSIPGLALLLRLFSDWLPVPFQYLGLYSAGLILLQAVAAWVLLRRVGFVHPVVTALAAVFFVIAPAFLWRFQGHFALASHGLILLMLALCFPTPGDRRALWQVLWPFALVLITATAVNPYISVLCLLVALAAMIRHRLLGLLSTGQALGLGLICVGLVPLGFLMFGFLIPGDVSNYAGGGYRYYSMNLLSPLDPQQYGGLLYDALPMAINGQYEGYNYLGLGLLGLLLVALAGRRLPVTALVRPDLWPLVGIVVVSGLAAVSATVALGDWVLIRFPLPGALESLAAMFRSSGRLFWPGYYLLMLVSLLWIRALRPRLAVPVLMIALGIQAADIAGLVSAIRKQTHAHIVSPLRSPEWDRLAARHDHLAVHPAWQCDPDKTPDGRRGFQTFGLYAARHGLTLNSYYNGRTGETDRDRHCRQAQSELLSGTVDPRSFYVFSDAFAARAAETVSIPCTTLDGFRVCSIQLTGTAASETGEPPVQPVEVR